METSKISMISSIPHILEVIFACEDNGSVTHITRKLKLSSTSLIYPALEKLKELEILKDELITKRGFRRNFSLTEKGIKVLEKLKEIENLL